MLFADNECNRPLLPASPLLLSRHAFLLFFIAHSLIGFASGVNIEASLLSSAVKQLRRKVPLLGRRESITRFTDDQTAGTFLSCTRDIVAIEQTIVRARRYANDCFIIFVLVYLRRLSYSLFNFLAKEL